MHTQAAGVHPDVPPEDAAAPTDADIDSDAPARAPAAPVAVPVWGSPMSWVTRPDPPRPRTIAAQPDHGRPLPP